MSTPNFSLPFPVLNDLPHIPQDIQALAEATDAVLAGTHFSLSATGVITSGGSTITANTTYAIDYTAAGFTSAPAILLSCYDAQWCAHMVHNDPAPTATAATILCRPEEGVGSTFVRVRWVALGN